MADTEGTPDFHLAAYVTNLGKYNEGYLVGEWVKFPVTPDEMQDVFRRIGIGGKKMYSVRRMRNGLLQTMIVILTGYMIC